MIGFLIQLINILEQLIFLLVVVSVVLSYFMPPYHPVRRTIDGIVEPMLAPIRRIVPLVGRFDISPLILIILVHVLALALNNLLSALR